MCLENQFLVFLCGRLRQVYCKFTRTKTQQTQDRTKTQKIHKRRTALERSVKILLEGLNRFNGANLTLNSDVDQDT